MMPAEQSEFRLLPELVIVGGIGGTNIGESFARAARRAGTPCTLIDSAQAWKGPALLQKALWRLTKRPIGLNSFSKTVVQSCLRRNRGIFLSTGIAPITSAALGVLRKAGWLTVNYQTDDPFGPNHRAAWFESALRVYDLIATPRHSTRADLRASGAQAILFVPFAYDPEIFSPVRRDDPAVHPADVFFAGGGDDDRLPYISAFLEEGLSVALYGSYWDRYPSTRLITRGMADASILRSAASSCAVAPCLVRRSNRDGHSMRTFEIPAMGGCVLAEDTEDHHAIFGEEGETTLYFRTPSEMVTKTKWLLDNPEERRRLATASHFRIINGRNTYADRLEVILAALGSNPFGRTP